jgi:hypothetical protein
MRPAQTRPQVGWSVGRLAAPPQMVPTVRTAPKVGQHRRHAGQLSSPAEPLSHVVPRLEILAFVSTRICQILRIICAWIRIWIVPNLSSEPTAVVAAAARGNGAHGWVATTPHILGHPHGPPRPGTRTAHLAAAYAPYTTAPPICWPRPGTVRHSLVLRGAAHLGACSTTAAPIGGTGSISQDKHGGVVRGMWVA